MIVIQLSVVYLLYTSLFVRLLVKRQDFLPPRLLLFITTALNPFSVPLVVGADHLFFIKFAESPLSSYTTCIYMYMLMTFMHPCQVYLYFYFFFRCCSPHFFHSRWMLFSRRCPNCCCFFPNSCHSRWLICCRRCPNCCLCCANFCGSFLLFCCCGCRHDGNCSWIFSNICCSRCLCVW